MGENRDYERLTLDGDIYIHAKDGSSCEYRAFLDNISFSGFAMFSLEKIEEGAVVEFNLITQALDQGLVGKGRIRHVTKPPQYETPLYTIGIEFTEVNTDLVTHIITRVQAKAALEKQAKKMKAGALDFMAF